MAIRPIQYSTVVRSFKQVVRNNFIMERTLWENRKYIISKCINLYMRCKSCGQEFNNLVGGVEYSSTVIGVSIFEIVTSIGLVLSFIGGRSVSWF
jgi:hypothetical protein